MNLFQTRRPRPFSHRPLYFDERKNNIGTIERRARREQGAIPPIKDDDSASAASPLQWRRTRVSRGMSTSRAVALIVALLLLLYLVV